LLQEAVTKDDVEITLYLLSLSGIDIIANVDKVSICLVSLFYYICVLTDKPIFQQGKTILHTAVENNSVTMLNELKKFPYIHLIVNTVSKKVSIYCYSLYAVCLHYFIGTDSVYTVTYRCCDQTIHWQCGTIDSISFLR
jgi:hypothetical protein